MSSPPRRIPAETRPARGSDLELVANALQRRQPAVERFLERMRCVPRIVMAKNLQLGHPLSEAEVEAVVQDALIAVRAELPRYDGSASLETWVYRFCVLELLEHLRRARPLHGQMEAVRAELQAEPAASPDPAGADRDRDARTTLSLAESIRLPPGEGQVELVLGSLLREEPEVPRKRPWPSLALAMVAAAMVVMFFVYDPWSRPGEARGGERLGSDSITIDYPHGAVDAWGAFVWEGALPPHGWYVVRVLDPSDSLIAESPALDQPLWTPEETLTAAWPSHIGWEVRLYHASSALVDTAYAEAWLSSR